MSNSKEVPIPRAQRGGISGYIKEIQREMQKVDWPTPKETLKLTGVVFAVIIIATTAVYLMSLASDTLVRLIQGRH